MNKLNEPDDLLSRSTSAPAHLILSHQDHPPLDCRSDLGVTLLACLKTILLSGITAYWVKQQLCNGRILSQT